MRSVSTGKTQQAIQALGELKSPEASFERAMVNDAYILFNLFVVCLLLC